MKILQVINSLAAGGAEKLTVDICNYLSHHGHSVSLFTFNSTKDVFDADLSDQVSWRKNKKEGFMSFVKIASLFRLIRAHDVIHVHIFPSFYIVGFLSFFFGKKKFIFTEHSTFNKRRSWKYKWIERIIYSRYKYVTCISAAVKCNLEAWLGQSKRYILINNFIDYNKINRSVAYSRKELSFSDEDRLIVMVGSFRNKSKDQASVIHAIAALPSVFKLLLIGDGILRAENESLVSNLCLQSRVLFMGNRTDVYKILGTCNYGVLSSNWEGFGIAALEYMACGLPAIGSDVEGLKEVIAQPLCRFTPGDSRGLASIILLLENDVEQKGEIIDSQRESLKQFDINIIMESFIKLYIS